jgi:hypothetical protein
MKRERAIEIAQHCAKLKPQSYYAEPFQPHEWVIDAILIGVRLYGAQSMPAPPAETRKVPQESPFEADGTTWTSKKWQSQHS